MEFKGIEGKKQQSYYTFDLSLNSAESMRGLRQLFWSACKDSEYVKLFAMGYEMYKEYAVKV